MRNREGVSLRVANYKSIGRDPVGFSRFARTNVLVGPNNSGKSAILDAIHFAVGNSPLPDETAMTGRKAYLLMGGPMDEISLQRGFQGNVSGGRIPGNHWEFAAKLVGKTLVRKFDGRSATEWHDASPPLDDVPAGDRQLVGDLLVQHVPPPFTGTTFLRVTADRDIRPEAVDVNLDVKPNGAGFTNRVRHFVTDFNQPGELIRQRLLAHVNQVFEPDTRYAEIQVQLVTPKVWEIVLREENGPRVQLSHCGSGLKTVLLVLGQMTFLSAGVKAGEAIVGLEELENNMHPALQRRLFAKVRDIALENDWTVFLTTHSPVAIDFFAHDADAQLLHIRRHKGQTSASLVRTYFDGCSLLDELDVRASDLLQANCIVWLEGPSDRLYFNRWIELITDGMLQEGVHYQCTFYGGRLLAHLSATEPGNSERIEILRLNRHAIVVIDSDKGRQEDELNETKRRIEAEVRKAGGVSWVTEGREIENYLSLSAIEMALKISGLVGVGPFVDLPEHVQGLAVPDTAKRLVCDKVRFAEQAVPHITRKDIDEVLDLTERLREVAAVIARWNSIAL